MVVEPRDLEDHGFKAPGMLQIFALEITPQGIKTPQREIDLTKDRLKKLKEMLR